MHVLDGAMACIGLHASSSRVKPVGPGRVGTTPVDTKVATMASTTTTSASHARVDVCLEEREGKKVALMTLHRPQAMNALTYEMLCALADAFRKLAQDRSVDVVVLTGAGDAFSAGIDLTAAQKVFKGDEDDLHNDVLHQMERCEVPIVGAVNGACITGGLEIALGCDILIASETAFFMDTHCKFGIMPSWGLSQKLPRIIGANRARWFSLSAEKIGARKAEAWGLVSEVVVPEKLKERALDIAASICRNQSHVVRGYKRVLNTGLGMSLAQGREMERREAWVEYRKMQPEDFARMKRFIAGKSSSTARPSLRSRL